MVNHNIEQTLVVLIEEMYDNPIKVHEGLYYSCCRELAGFRPWIHNRNLHLLIKHLEDYMTKERIRGYVGKLGKIHDLRSCAEDEEDTWSFLGTKYLLSRVQLEEAGWEVIPVTIKEDE